MNKDEHVLVNTMLNKSQTVSDQIIDIFLDSLGNEDGFQEIATRLHTTIIDNKKTSENSLRKALFDEDEE